jgi:uncharacterized protein (TIGR03437 family)
MQTTRILLAGLVLAAAVFGQEVALPLTSRLQSRIPANGIPAEAFYLPGSAEIGCLEATPSGRRFLCLSDSGTIIEWTPDNRIRLVADGFTGPLQAKAAPDGTLFVLDLGRGTLSRVSPTGEVTRIMGAGSDRVIRERMDPATFDLPLFTLSRDTYRNSVQLSIDPQGNPYLGILREENTIDAGQAVTRRFLYIFRLENQQSSLVLHWNGSSVLAGRNELPEFRALSIDKDRLIFFSMDGLLFRLSPGLTYSALVNGTFTPFNNSPIQQIVQTDDGNIFIQSSNSGRLFRLAFAELRVDLDLFGTLRGPIARQGGNVIGYDIPEKRLVRFEPDAASLFVAREQARLLRLIPTTGSTAFRAAFDFPVSVSLDNQSQVYVAEAADGSVYRIAANGVLQRVSRTTFNPDRPPTGTGADITPIDAMPYPAVAVANDSTGRLFFLDRNCGLYTQLGATTARRVKQFAISAGCGEASMLFDQQRRLHVAFFAAGEIHTGTGDVEAGEWNFSRIYSAPRIRSMSLLNSGDLLVLETQANVAAWQLRRLNPSTLAAVTLRLDDSLRNAQNVRFSSVAADFGGRIIAVSCCTAGSSNESGRRFLYSLQLSATDVLSGQPRPVFYFDGPAQAADQVFSHPRGALIRTNQNRLYYFEDPQFRNESAVSLPNRQTWTYQPDAGVQELAVPVNPVFGPTAFRAKVSCSGNFDRFVRVGPSAAVAPTQLRLALDTLAAPSRSATCQVELGAVDSARVLATTTIELVPDAARLAQIPSISLLEQLDPFRVDPAEAETTRTVRLFNNSPEPVAIRLEGRLPEGVEVTPPVLALEPKQSGEFTFKLTAAKLFRQNYQIPLKAVCANCNREVDLSLRFQITGRATSIAITAESALVDIASMNTRNVSRLAATSIVLDGLEESDLVVKTDLGETAPWYKVERSSSTRTEDGKLVLGYDVVLNREALPGRQTSSIVTFETLTQTGVARRFLTVFFFPEGSTVQRLFESAGAGNTVNLASSSTATVTLPVFSRATSATAYSTYTLGGASGSVSVPSVQGVVGRGANEISFELTKSGTAAEASEIKDIVVVFANGERLIYTLNVLTRPLTAAASTAKSGLRAAAGACTSARLLISQKEPGVPYTVVRNVGQRFLLEVKDECNQLINATDKAQVRFTTEPANGSVTITSVGNGMWEVFWRPERTAENVAVKVVAVRGVSEREIYAGTLTVTGRVTDSAVPGLRSFSIVDGISYLEKSITAPGAFITLYGDNLAEQAEAAPAGTELPSQLAGVEVLFNGKPAPLLYASPGQVNLQVPYELENTEYRLTVRRGDLVSAPSALGVGAASPALFSLDGSGGGLGYAFRYDANGTPSLITPDNPVRPGELFLLIAAGLGATNPFVVEGKATPLQVSTVTNSVEIAVGDALAENVVAYLEPGRIGWYFVRGTMPASAPKGDAVPVIVRVSGVESQTVTLPIRD